jgi:preprotein translocase subunit SecE
MAKKSGSSPSAIKSRAAKTAAALNAARPAGSAVAASATAPAPPKKKTNPMQFLREVRAEARKISWTSRKETWITSVMVLIMVVITAIFFMIVDWGLGTAVAQILKLATPG